MQPLTFLPSCYWATFRQAFYLHIVPVIVSIILQCLHFQANHQRVFKMQYDGITEEARLQQFHTNWSTHSLCDGALKTVFYWPCGLFCSWTASTLKYYSLAPLCTAVMKQIGPFWVRVLCFLLFQRCNNIKPEASSLSNDCQWVTEKTVQTPGTCLVASQALALLWK